MADDQDVEDVPKPLGIKCTSSDCDNGLHCFRQTRRLRRDNIRGICRECGANLVDWERVRRHDLSDVDYTFEALKYELIRHHFWHVPIERRAVNHAKRKGKSGIREASVRRIRVSVASPHHPRQGRQTPFSGNVLYYAQHAVVACCRACIEEWHDIPQDRDLTEEEVLYLAELVTLYVFHRLPDLTENGEKIPADQVERRSTAEAGSVIACLP
jgi:hypothetical protein